MRRFYQGGSVCPKNAPAHKPPSTPEEEEASFKGKKIFIWYKSS